MLVCCLIATGVVLQQAAKCSGGGACLTGRCRALYAQAEGVVVRPLSAWMGLQLHQSGLQLPLTVQLKTHAIIQRLNNCTCCLCIDCTVYGATEGQRAHPVTLPPDDCSRLPR